MNIRSIQDDEVFDMRVGSLIICCKPNCAVTFSISFLRDWICHENTIFFIWGLNLQLTQLGMDYFDTKFPSLIRGYQSIFQIRLGCGLK